MSSESTDPVPQAVLAPPAPDPVETTYRELEARVREFRPSEDLAPLEKAFRFAADRHKGQKRSSGEPYMLHPLLVTRQLADMHMDMVALETGLLQTASSKVAYERSDWSSSVSDSGGTTPGQDPSGP